jgi:hypothetical protein
VSIRRKNYLLKVEKARFPYRVVERYPPVLALPISSQSKRACPMGLSQVGEKS